MSTRVALVTGASRGIGKAAAIALAKAGFDVAIAARTVHEGEGEDWTEPGRPVVGSLESTAAAIAETGRRALPVRIDLADRSCLSAAVARVLDQWGRIDVLVNNAAHRTSDHNSSFADMALTTLEDELEANIINAVVLTKLVLPSMLERKSGTLISITSTAGYMDPPLRAGKGGWSASYGMFKGALHRLAGVLALELAERGIHAFNLQPGFVITERLRARMEDGSGPVYPYAGAPPAALGAVIAWLATNPQAASLNGKTIEGQLFALEHGLYPDWRQSKDEVSSIGPKVSVW
jgi:NAD(P)-dependent dehydrogenase (short-subunit alcohol dehydrogenase family)